MAEAFAEKFTWTREKGDKTMPGSVGETATSSNIGTPKCSYPEGTWRSNDTPFQRRIVVHIFRLLPRYF